MNKELVQKVYDDTYKSHTEEKQNVIKEKIQEIVKEYLIKVDNLVKRISELQDERKQLRLTLDDIKLGKLGLIEDRIKKDDKARKVNIIEITEIHNHNYPPYLQPYVVTMPAIAWPGQNPIVYCSGGNAGGYSPIGSSGSAQAEVIGTSFTTTGADCKNYAVGAYTINGESVHFR